jgi:hypothetical protein
MMNIPNSGPAILLHNQIMIEENTYSYFRNRNTSEFNLADTATGPYLIAYTDQALAGEVYNKVFKDEFAMEKITNVDMTGFYRSVKSSNKGKEEISGVLLNLPVGFITGEDNLIFEQDLPAHMFPGNELLSKFN